MLLAGPPLRPVATNRTRPRPSVRVRPRAVAEAPSKTAEAATSTARDPSTAFRPLGFTVSAACVCALTALAVCCLVAPSGLTLGLLSTSHPSQFLVFRALAVAAVAVATLVLSLLHRAARDAASAQACERALIDQLHGVSKELAAAKLVAAGPCSSSVPLASEVASATQPVLAPPLESAAPPLESPALLESPASLASPAKRSGLEAAGARAAKAEAAAVVRPASGVAAADARVTAGVARAAPAVVGGGSGSSLVAATVKVARAPAVTRLSPAARAWATRMKGAELDLS